MYADHLTDGLLGGRRRRRKGGKARLWIPLLVAALVLGAWWRRQRAEQPTRYDGDALHTLEAPEIVQAPVLPFAYPENNTTERDGPTVTPTYVEGELEAGQSVLGTLLREGVPNESAQPVIAAMGEIFDFRHAQVGDHYEVSLMSDGRIATFRYQTSAETIYEVRWVGDGTYSAQLADLPLQTQVVAVSGTVETSLYDAFQRVGETTVLAQQVVDIFQWDIDFSSQVRTGDAFRLLTEKIFLDGEFLRYGHILAVEYRGGLVSAEAYYFDEEEFSGYYTPDGRPVERMFLAAPCHYRRISSPFDLERMHPVLHERRPHNGVDYAANTGTPVVAAADGEVTYAGMRGASGNLIRIEHANGYETGYAHLSGFAAGIRRGREVHQGQLIGYVGSTGRSTGPHLHFGMKLHGEYIDPLGSHNARGPSLTGRYLRDFQRRQSQLQAELDDIMIADVARIDEPRAVATESLEPLGEED